MFRISHVLGTHREHDRRCIAEVQALLVAAFPDLADVPDYVERKLAEQTTRVYPTVLLTAHGPGDQVIGFALADHFEWIGYAYLDFIVTQAEQRGRGLGGALYEALRAGPDGPGGQGPLPRSPHRRPDAGRQPRRTSSRTRTGSSSTSGTTPGRSSAPSTTSRSAPASPPEPRLLYDPLDHDRAARRPTTLREVIAAILTLRYNYEPDDRLRPPGPRLGQGLARSRSASRSTPRPRRRRTRSPGGSTR